MLPVAKEHFLIPLVGPFTSDVFGNESHDHGVVINKLPGQGGWHIRVLFLDQLAVSLHRAGGLDLPAISSGLISLLAELEAELCVLEGGGGLDRPLVSVHNDVLLGLDGVGHLSGYHSDTDSLHVLIKVLRVDEVPFSL